MSDEGVLGVVSGIVQPLQSLLATVGIDVSPVILLSILIALVILALGSLFTRATTAKRARGTTLFLLGLSNSGKTAMFYQLQSGKFPNTVVSMRPNEASITLPEGKTVKVVDFPGHHRLREELISSLGTAGALVFVVDAVNIKNETRPVAQFLYDIFTNVDVNKASLPILVACNKQDIVTATRPSEVQALLERELDQLRSTRASTPMQEGTQRGEEIFLGIEGEKFNMAHLPLQVAFVDCSAKDNDLDSVKSWMASNM